MGAGALVQVPNAVACRLHLMHWLGLKLAKLLHNTVKEVYLCRPGDEFHLVHVIPKLQMPVIFGAPPVDFLPQQDPEAHEKMTLHAQLFIEERYLPRLAGFEPPAAVHIVKVTPVQGAGWFLETQEDCSCKCRAA